MKNEILIFAVSLFFVFIITILLVYFIFDPWLNGKKDISMALKVSWATLLTYFVIYFITKLENKVSKKDRVEFLTSLKKTEYLFGVVLGYLMIILMFFGMFS